jgi:hypothetical protein
MILIRQIWPINQSTFISTCAKMLKYIMDLILQICKYVYLLRRPFKNIKLVGNERKGLRTNFPKWREATNQIIFNISFYQNNIIIKVFNYFRYRLVMGDTRFFGFHTIPVRYHEFWSIPIPKSIPKLNFSIY